MSFYFNKLRLSLDYNNILLCFKLILHYLFSLKKKNLIIASLSNKLLVYLNFKNNFTPSINFYSVMVIFEMILLTNIRFKVLIINK